MKPTTYASIYMLAIVWICGSINACERIGLGQALLQIVGGLVVMGWAFYKGRLWRPQIAPETKEME